MSKKPIIIFEGIEASGKTFHSNIVCNYLKKKKIKFTRIREPGGSKNSEKIRRLILDNRSDFNKYTDLLLYLAARSENISKIKKDYMKKVIIIDRFTDSTIAYQHYGMGLNLNLIKNINKILLRDIKVSFTFLNIVSLNNMKKRLKSRKKLNRYDKFNGNFYKKVQNGFIKLAGKNNKKYQIINSNLDIELNKLSIIKKVEKLIR